MDGNGSLFGTLSGNSREILGKFSVDLPKKHGRGGQSALRFARLRMEKRHNYVRKVAETAVQFFISGDKVNVAGIVLAGSADFKTELSQSDMFDGRLQAAILAVVDVSYGKLSRLQELNFLADAPNCRVLSNIRVHYVRAVCPQGVAGCAVLMHHMLKYTSMYCWMPAE